MKKIQKIRGAHEINPSESQTWSYLTKKITEIFESFSYQEIRLPIIESTSLFQRSVGEGTDIVNKEMFTFNSKSEKSLTLRPEGTAGCMRVAISQGLLDKGPQNFFIQALCIDMKDRKKEGIENFFSSVQKYLESNP